MDLLADNMAEERIFELEDIATETSKLKKRWKTEKKKGKKKNKQNIISKNRGTPSKDVTYTKWEHQKEKKEWKIYLKQQ